MVSTNTYQDSTLLQGRQTPEVSGTPSPGGSLPVRFTVTVCFFVVVVITKHLRLATLYTKDIYLGSEFRRQNYRLYHYKTFGIS